MSILLTNQVHNQVMTVTITTTIKKKVIKSTGKFIKSQKLKLVKFPWYSVVRMFTIKFGYNASCH